MRKSLEYWNNVLSICQILVFICLILLAFIPATGKIKDGRIRAIWKKYTLKGKTVIMIAIIATLLYAFQLTAEHISKEIQSSIDLSTKRTEHLQDSLKDIEIAKSHTKELQENEKRIISYTYTSFLEFKARSDSNVVSIKKAINDSLRSLPDPEFAFCSDHGINVDSITVTELFLSIDICNTQAPSYNVKGRIYFVYEYHDKFSLLNVLNDDELSQNDFNTAMAHQVKYQLKNIPIDYLFCLLKGTLYDSKGKKHEIWSLTGYNFLLKSEGIATGEHQNRLKAFLHESEL